MMDVYEKILPRRVSNSRQRNHVYLPESGILLWHGAIVAERRCHTMILFRLPLRLDKWIWKKIPDIAKDA
jgi:hypothetical protein